MRKLLLATMAATIASIGGAGIADAQVVTIPTLVPGTGPFGPAAPTPGTVVVRLGGRIQTYFGVESGSGDSVTTSASTTGGYQGTTTIPAGSYKEANYTLGNLIYLYPSVDGVAANGLQYGAFIELRDEGSLVAAGGGSQGSISGQDRKSWVYVRRSYGYLGAASFGTVRFGTADGPVGLFETGDFEGFNDGGFNGEGESLFNSSPAFPFPSGQGFEYATNKIVYLSPQFSGFDFGVSFEPNTGGVNGYNGICGYAQPGCDSLSSSTVAGDAGRRRDTIEAAGRYRGTFGPVGIAADIGWVGSQHVESGVGVSTRYHGLDYGTIGATATFAGFTIGGNGMYGDFNNAWALVPVGEKASGAIIVGAQYTTGPITVGASVFQYNSSDNMVPTNPTIGNYRSRGLAAGGTYSITPGVSAYLSLLIGDQKQAGVNLLGDTETPVLGAKGQVLNHNQISAQGLTIGTNIRW